MGRPSRPMRGSAGPSHHKRETVTMKLFKSNGEYIRQSEAKQQDNHTRRQAAAKLSGRKYGENGGKR